MRELTPEEEKELAELEALEQEELEKDTPSGLERAAAGVAGAVQGATFGFADEIASAQKTVNDLIGTAYNEVKSKGLQGIPDTLATAGETYSKNAEQYRKVFKTLEERNKIVYNTGDIAGSVISAWATGGGSALIGAGLRQGVKTLGVSALQGAAHGLGRGEGETLEQHLENSATGSAWDVGGTLIGGGLGHGIAKGGKAVTNYFGKESFLNYLGAHTGKIRQSVENNARKFGKTVNEWADRMTSYTTKSSKGADEYIIQGNRTPQELLELFKFEQKVANESMEDVLGSLKQLPEADGFSLYRRIRNNVLDPQMSKARLSDMKKSIKEVDGWIKGELYTAVPSKNAKEAGAFIDMPVNRKLQDIQFLKKDIYELEDGSTLVSQLKRDVAKDLNNYIKDTVKTSAELTPSMKNKFFTAWTKSGDLADAHKVVNAKMSQGDNSLINFFKSYLTRNSLSAFMISRATGTSYLTAAVAGLAIEKMATHPRVAAPVSRGLLKLSKAFSVNPQAYEKVAQELISASAISSDAFEEALTHAGAEVDLREEPLARTTSEVLRRKDVVLTRVGKQSPEIAEKLRDAIENDDKEGIRGIMAALAETSKSGTIQPGMGWDGKAVTESEQQRVQQWIKSIRDIRKKKQLSTDFTASGNIPEEMLTGKSGQGNAKQFIYEKAKDKVRNPEY